VFIFIYRYIRLRMGIFVQEVALKWEENIHDDVVFVLVDVQVTAKCRLHKRRELVKLQHNAAYKDCHPSMVIKRC